MPPGEGLVKPGSVLDWKKVGSLKVINSVLKMPYTPRPDDFGVASNCTPATVDYFIEIFGYQEAVELSNIESPTGNQVNHKKIQIALNDAAILINNFITTAPPQGKLLIAGSYRRTQAVLARSYLDILRPRQQVLEAAKEALQQLDLWAARQSPSSGLRWQEAYRYWNSGCVMTQSSYRRGRSFTEPSMARWVLREGTNSRWNPAPRLEAASATRGREKEPNGQLDHPIPIPNSVMEGNELFDALETTRDLASFQDAKETRYSKDGDVIVVNDEDNLSTYDGLQESDTF